MTKLRHAICLVAVLLSGNAAALQLGQLTTYSALGENLDARIALYGVPAGLASSIDVELRAEIGAPRGSPERAAVATMSIHVIDGEGAAPYVALRSSAPISEPIIRFRVRASPGESTTIGHYSLALAPPVRSVRPPAGRVPVPRVGSGEQSSGESYGPVRSGQTLSGIMRELGLTAGERGAMIEPIVAANPHAFNNSDPDGLRVGVILKIPSTVPASLPEAQPVAARRQDPAPIVEAASAAPAPLVEPIESASDQSAPIVARADLDMLDQAAHQARMEALATKFAAIKARFNEQLNSRPTRGELVPPPAPATGASPTDAQARTTTEAKPVARGVIQPQSQPADTTTSIAMVIVLGSIGAIIAVFATRRVISMVADRRRHARHGHANAGDQALVAQIAAKAEKRLQLESEVKRRLSEKRTPDQTAPSTVEHSVDRAAETESLDEIENRIAHGQYAEAEAMLNDIIAKTPNNVRAKLRLAEIYYLNERTEEFVEIAAQLSAQHRADIGDEGWQRVMRMGRVIAPDRPPFSGPVGVERQA